MGIKEIQEDVDEMSKVYDNPGIAGGEENATDPPATEASGTEAPGTEAAATEAPGTEAPGTETPGTEAPSTEAPEEDSKDKEIRELREKIAEKDAVSKPTEAPPTSAPATDAPIAEEDFIGDIDLVDLSTDPKLFNQLLNKINQNAIRKAREEIRRGDETVIRSMPDMVKYNIALVTKLDKVNKAFYEENKDLVPWKKVVGAVFEELIAESPNKTYEELLPEVSKTTRERLALSNQAIEKDKNNTDDPPKLPHKKGGKRQTSKPDTNPLADELNAMDKVLDY